MKNRIRVWWDDIPAKGGIIGALLGTIVSVRLHRENDRQVKKAGKTALFAGAGFLLGNLIEKNFMKKIN